MATYKIIEMGNQILREPAKRVPKITNNIIKLLNNMADTLYNAKGVGLAAPQVGVSKRVIIVDDGEGLLELINPEILETEGEDTDTEGCLSVPGTMGDITRPETIKLKYQDRLGQEQTIQVCGLRARAIQHEIDHLNGILIVDIASNLRNTPQE